MSNNEDFYQSLRVKIADNMPGSGVWSKIKSMFE
jgi:hypothetical protein